MSRRMRYGGGTALAAIFWVSVMLAACTTTIVPPRDVKDPVTVHLVDHGRHPSLVLPLPDGGLVGYAYGDWNYFALDKHGLGSTISAALWPTRGALGRRKLAAGARAGNLPDHYTAEHIYTFVVERERSEALRARLNEEFQRNLDSRIYNELYELEFVHSEQKYTAFRNSNHVTAGWIEELGCKVSGSSYSSSWKVQPPPGDDP